MFENPGTMENWFDFQDSSAAMPVILFPVKTKMQLFFQEVAVILDAAVEKVSSISGFGIYWACWLFA